MAARAVTALFDSQEDAARVIDRIEAAGVPQTDIGIVSLNATDRTAGAVSTPSTGEPTAVPGGHESSAAEGAGAGATVGTVLGGGAGLLASLGLLAIPGAGPVIAAGWLVAALSGAGVGAAAGGLIGALTGAGLSGADAETYAEGIRRGGTLVTVRADGETADRVIALMQRGGAIDLDERAEGWRAQGWTGGTAGAPPRPERPHRSPSRP
ncbi:General stress protein 17M-like domain-containing protein [Methylorubrum aminovorans]